MTNEKLQELRRNADLFRDALGKRYGRVGKGGVAIINSKKRDGTHFDRCRVLLYERANMRNCLLENVTLENTGGFDLVEEPWERITFADLRQSAFLNCQFNFAHTFNLADVLDTVMVGCTFSGGVYRRVIFTGGHSQNCAFTGITFKDCTFAARMSTTAITKDVIKDCTFTDCVFEDSHLQYANFDGCTFTRCTFKDSDIGHFTFAKSKLIDCNDFAPLLANPRRTFWRGKRLTKPPVVIPVIYKEKDTLGYTEFLVSVAYAYGGSERNTPGYFFAVRREGRNSCYFGNVRDGIRNLKFFGDDAELIKKVNNAIAQCVTLLDGVDN